MTRPAFCTRGAKINKMRARERIKKTLLELLKTNSADQLAVKTLVMESHVSKQTLYNNFYGILDAVSEAVCNLVDEAAGDCFTHDTWMDGLLSILKMFEENREIMLHLWQSKWRYEVLNSVADHIYPVIVSGINDCGKKAGLNVNDNDKETMAGLYLDIFMGLVQRYMSERMAQDPERLVRIYESILEKDTSNGLKRISELYK